MKTVEEVKQLINQRLIELKELPSSVWICKELEVLLAIIDEPPPCTHSKLIYWSGAVLAPGDLPKGWYSVRNNNNTALDKYSFCPDCGEKLND